MNFKDVRKEFSSITEMAHKLGVTVATCYNWKRKGIPVKSQELIAFKMEKMKMDEMQDDGMDAVDIYPSQLMNELDELIAERYQRLMAAFSELIRAKVSTDTLDTLKFESGLLPEDFDKLKEEQK